MVSVVQESPSMVSEVVERKIGPFDFCDSCGQHVRAVAIVETNSGDLLFCGHHLRANLPPIIAAQYQIHTELDILRDILFLNQEK